MDQYMITESFIKGVDFVYVYATDIAEAEKFYGEVLGLPISARYGKMPGVEFETGSLTLAVIDPVAFGMQFSASDQAIALHVDDVAQSRELLESRGVEFTAGTIDSGVCHMAFFKDPSGNDLLLHKHYAPRT